MAKCFCDLLLGIAIYFMPLNIFSYFFPQSIAFEDSIIFLWVCHNLAIPLPRLLISFQGFIFYQ